MLFQQEEEGSNSQTTYEDTFKAMHNAYTFYFVEIVYHKAHRSFEWLQLTNLANHNNGYKYNNHHYYYYYYKPVSLLLTGSILCYHYHVTIVASAETTAVTTGTHANVAVIVLVSNTGY